MSRTNARTAIPAVAVFAGTVLSLVGWSWDVQWHFDVGPDTFFTMPHLFLYAGSALCGITALAVVLRTTSAQRAGRDVDPAVGGRAIRVFGGRFTAPAAYLVTGTAAATFLFYGLWDQWWHGLYGFDATLNSPPHVGLLLGNVATIIGATMAFTAMGDERWGRIGVFASLGVLVSFLPVPTDVFQQIPGPVNWSAMSLACLTALLLLMAAAYFRRPGSTLLVAVSVAVVQGALWLFTPWATEVYAAAMGLSMREFPAPAPIMPSWIPMTAVVAALIVEGGLALARSRHWSPRKAVALSGALAAAVLAALLPLQQALLFGSPLPPFTDIVLYLAPGCVAALALGAPAGIAAWRFGLMLRQLHHPSSTAPALGATA